MEMLRKLKFIQKKANLETKKSFFGTTEYISDQLNINMYISHQFKWKDHQLTSGLDFKRLERIERYIIPE